MIRQKISAAPSVRRLPSYLHIIRQMRNEGGGYIPGTVIARELNLEPIQVRKDLAITGIAGKPKRGYLIEDPIRAIERFLHWDSVQDTALVGAGNLGTALLGYREFQLHGLHIRAVFDKSPGKIGAVIHGVKVLPADTMETRIRSLGIKMSILTVPSSAAQETADILIRAGVEGIWNFTNLKLRVPENVAVQKEDLSSGYAMLSVMMQARGVDGDDTGKPD